jgi:hypothetical protein
MFKTVVSLDCAAQGEVIGADEIGSMQGDQERAFGRSRADALDRGQLSDRFVIGEIAQVGLG